MRRDLILFIAFAVSIAAQQTPRVEADRIAQHVRILASGDFEGRAPGTKGEKKTVDYITAQLTQAGLKPGGDPDGHGARRWTQDVPLVESEITGPVAATLKIGAASKSLRQAEDIAIRATMIPGNSISIRNAPLVFTGYGVSAPERKWDDFKGLDVRGKVLIELINDPDFEADLGGRFDGKAMTYYGRWTYKYEEAARRGALGVLIVHETDPAAYGWATVKNSNTQPTFDIHRARPADEHVLLEAWIQRGIAVDLFRAAGLDFEAEKKKAQSPDFRPTALKNSTVSVSCAIRQTEVVSKNIAGIVTGSSHPNETVVYSAHWDHLGVGQPDARGDRIYNGAQDNALGVAGLLELARIYASAPPSGRSVLFLFVTAEEKGLLGSEYYGQHPLYPLALTAAVYNTDGGSVSGPSHDVAIAGDGKVSLQLDLAKGAEEEGRRLSPDPSPEKGSFYRSDHFSFAKAGVPAISFRPGEDLIDGGPAAGRLASDDYTANRYHQPADEYSDTWNLKGEVQNLELLYRLGRNMANSRVWPEWLAGSEFKSIRDRTAAERKP